MTTQSGTRCNRTTVLVVLALTVTLAALTRAAFGQAISQCCQFALARYNMDGTLDTSFGDGGKVLTSFSSYGAAYAMTLDRMYRRVVVGTVYMGSDGFQFAVARYKKNGALDTAFSFDGVAITDFHSSSDERAYAVAVDALGKIVVAGDATVGGQGQIAIVRYNTDGSRDTTFGDGDGKVVTDLLSSTSEHAKAVAIDSRGKIFVAGRAFIDGGSQFALVGYNADGSLDTDFGGGDGKVVTDFASSASEWANAIAIGTDGQIVLAGGALMTAGEDYRFALARYNTDGSLDTAFAGIGKVLTNFTSSTREWAHAVAIDRDGKIVAAGQASVGAAGVQFALARYNSDGSLDTTFGNGIGRVLTNFISSSGEAALSVAVFGSSIFAAGFASVGGDYQFALARYGSDGSLDTTFSGDGKLATNFQANDDPLMGIAEGATAIAIDMSGQEVKVVVAGWVYSMP